MNKAITIGQFIRAQRKSCGLTQRQLGALAGVSQTTICRIETGKTAFAITQVLNALLEQIEQIEIMLDQVGENPYFPTEATRMTLKAIDCLLASKRGKLAEFNPTKDTIIPCTLETINPLYGGKPKRWITCQFNIGETQIRYEVRRTVSSSRWGADYVLYVINQSQSTMTKGAISAILAA